jgi:cell division protein FtsL
VVEGPERTPAQRRRTLQWAAIAGVAFGLCVALGLVYLHVVLAQRQFRVDRLQSQVQAEQAAYQKLRLQVAQLASPASIISIAEGRLGMVQPGSITYLPSVPGDASGGTAPSAHGTAPSAGGSEAGVSGSASAGAPTGDADWPVIKSQLAGSP